MWTPQPRGTQLRLRCSVVGLLRAPLAPRLSGSRGSPPVRFLPSPRLGLAFWLPQSRILAAVLGPWEPLGGEDSRPLFRGVFRFGYKSASGYSCSRPPSSIEPGSSCEITWSSVVTPRLLLPALVMAADGLHLRRNGHVKSKWVHGCYICQPFTQRQRH